jgi:hypothetical protein
MRSLLALLAIAVLCLVATGCGTAATSSGGYIKGDSDSDFGGNKSDSDDWRTREYGREANGAERREVTAVVKRYYAAAAVGDGATVCATLYAASIARSFDLEREVPEQYAPAPGSSVLRGKSCSQVASLLLQINHQSLVANLPSMRVIDVRVNGADSLALLGFRTTGEREVPLKREGGTWKINALLDREII